jgi:hypothetical protein
MQCRLCWITVLSESAWKQQVEEGKEGTAVPPYARIGPPMQRRHCIGLLVSYEPQTKYNHELCQKECCIILFKIMRAQ